MFPALIPSKRLRYQSQSVTLADGKNKISGANRENAKGEGDAPFPFSFSTRPAVTFYDDVRQHWRQETIDLCSY